MTKPSYLGANVEVDTDTFASFVAKTNWIIDDMGKTVVTVAPVTDANTTNGAWSAGNAHIEGVLSTKVSAIDELRGGTVANPASINLSSNVVPMANSSPSIGVSSNRIPNVFTVNTNILTLTANLATITTGNVVALSSNAATIQNGNVVALTSNLATITTGNVATLIANVATITSGNVVSLSSDVANVATLNATTATLTDANVTANTMTVNMHVTGDLRVDGITALSSNAAFAVNTSIISHLTVQNIAQIDGNTIIGSANTDSLVVNAKLNSNLVPNGNNNVLGSTDNQFKAFISTIDSDVTFTANTTVGNANTDSLVVNAKLNSNLVPNGNNIFLGSTDNRFKGYISNIENPLTVTDAMTIAAAGVSRVGLFVDPGNDRLVLRKYTSGGAFQADMRIDGSGVNDLKFLGSTVWHAGNDGAGSTLDADLLDGQQGSFYQDIGNATGTANKDRLPATLNAITVPSVTISGTEAVARSVDTSVMNLYGGTFGSGANLELYGGSHATNANQAYYDAAQHNFRGVGGSGTPTFTIGGNTVWHAGNDGAGSGLDADLLDGQSSAYYRDLVNSTGTLPDARLTGAYTGITTLSQTGLHTISPGGGEAIRINGTLSTDDPYVTFYKADVRQAYIQHSDGTSIGQGFRFFNDVTDDILYLSNSNTIDALKFYDSSTAQDNTVWHSGNLVAADINTLYGYTPANGARNLTAGNGLTGGGNLTADRTFTLGTPGTTSGSSTNAVTATSHTHQLDLVSGDITSALGFTPIPNRNLTAGNGLTGGGDLTANRTFTLGTPSAITNSTTDSVTTTSHTHSLGFAAAEVYTGSTSGNLNYPIGTVLFVQNEGTQPARNGSDTIYLLGTYAFSFTASGTALTGTWRSRGQLSSYISMQRTA